MKQIGHREVPRTGLLCTFSAWSRHCQYFAGFLELFFSTQSKLAREQRDQLLMLEESENAFIKGNSGCLERSS